MIPRLRMARKRLMVARLRAEARSRAYWYGPVREETAEDYAQWRCLRAKRSLRAIERRKDRIA